MKNSLLFMLTILSACFVHAADRKLGNVILVERDVDNIYDRCVKTISTSVKEIENPNQKPDAIKYYFCTVQITKNPAETLLNKGIAFFNHEGPRCQVESQFGNGKLLITFYTEIKNATEADAKRCLKRTIDSNPDVVATIQTVE